MEELKLQTYNIYKNNIYDFEPIFKAICILEKNCDENNKKIIDAINKSNNLIIKTNNKIECLKKIRNIFETIKMFENKIVNDVQHEKNTDVLNVLKNKIVCILEKIKNNDDNYDNENINSFCDEVNNTLLKFINK